MRLSPQVRGVARFIAQTGVMVAAVMIALSAWALLSPGVRAGLAAAANAGDAQVIGPIDGTGGSGQLLAAGSSGTDFTLRLTAGAACTKDSPNDSYRVQSYMVPASVDPASLTFDSQGPVPFGTGTGFRQPLYDTNSSPYVNAQTAAATDPGGPGPVVNVPTFDLAVYAPGDVPAGSYNLGIACTLGPPSGTQVDKYWNAQIAVVVDTADAPAGIRWTAAQTGSSTTTSEAPTTTTTTATAGATTTTAVASTTTTTTVSGTSTTMAATSGSGGSGSGTAGATGLARTGSGTASLLMWSALLLVFGRMAVLLGRVPRVLGE